MGAEASAVEDIAWFPCRRRCPLSIYFFNPRLDAQLPVLRLAEELAARARGVSDDPSNDSIYAVYGRNAWNSRVRAHPDVAAAHDYM